MIISQLVIFRNLLWVQRTRRISFLLHRPNLINREETRAGRVALYEKPAIIVSSTHSYLHHLIQTILFNAQLAAAGNNPKEPNDFWGFSWKKAFPLFDGTK